MDDCRVSSRMMDAPVRDGDGCDGRAGARGADAQTRGWRISHENRSCVSSRAFASPAHARRVAIASSIADAKPRAPYLTFIPRDLPVADVCRVRAQGNAVSSGYAAALVDACKSGGVLEQVHADMETLDAYVKANAAVAGFLANPTMAVEKKKDILAKLGKEAGFHAFTSNFLNLLVDKKRENQLETIIAEFETLFCEATDTQVR